MRARARRRSTASWRCNHGHGSRNGSWRWSPIPPEPPTHPFPISDCRFSIGGGAAMTPIQNPKSKIQNGNDRLRPLSQPAPAAVEATPEGEPKAMLWRGVFKRVAAVHDSWRIDDEWWREEIARRYFAVELEGGRRVTVYHDLVQNLWYAQAYE